MLDDGRLPDQESAQSRRQRHRLPRLIHPRAGLSHARWSALSPSEKLERLFGMSLDDIHEIQSRPMGEFDPFRLSVRMQVMRVVFMIGLKAHLDGTLA